MPPGLVDTSDGSVRRDVYFSDLAYVRRQSLRHAVAGVALTTATLALLFTRFVWPLPLYLWMGMGGIAHGTATSWREWQKLRAVAANDALLGRDPRIDAEDRRGRSAGHIAFAVSLVEWSAAGLLLGAALVSMPRAVASALEPTPIRILDVTAVNVDGSFDERSVSLDIVDRRLARVGSNTLETLPKGARSFEALGKFVASGTLDLSTPDPMAGLRRTWMRPLTVGAPTDVVVFDVDPRVQDVGLRDIAAAVVSGKYFSRTDIQNALAK